jgi:hypothetical protein
LSQEFEPKFHDKKGVPIYPGDLLKSDHFIGARRKRYYLYHVACLEDGYLFMVPTARLDQSRKRPGGKCLLSQDIADTAVVIDGTGPGDILDHEDRPKVKGVRV